MSDVKQSDVFNKAKRVRTLTQYTKNGNVSRPTRDSKPTLESGVYRIGSDIAGVFFDVHEVNTDDLLRFEDSRYNQILEEVSKFWELKPKFKSLGFTAKRGIIMYGRPGVGKSCLIKTMMEDVVSDGNVVFISNNPYSLVEGLKMFKEVEPERKCLVVLEEVDEMLYNVKVLSDLFDGDDQIDDVLFVGTTNYIDRIPQKMLREGRFDRKVEVLPPPIEGRLEYLRQKLGMLESDDTIHEHAEITEDFTFAQLREFLIGVYCYDKNPNDVAENIASGSGLHESKKEKLDEKKLENELYQALSMKYIATFGKDDFQFYRKENTKENKPNKKPKAVNFLENRTKLSESDVAKKASEALKLVGEAGSIVLKAKKQTKEKNEKEDLDKALEGLRDAESALMGVQAKIVKKKK